MMQPDFSTITEAPGLQATHVQLQRLYQRYHFAKEYCQNKDILEVACGTGIGLGYLASVSKSVCGIDIDERNLSIARDIYKNTSIRIERGDAQQMTFNDATFDVVLLFEAIYYLPVPMKFIAECK